MSEIKTGDSVTINGNGMNQIFVILDYYLNEDRKHFSYYRCYYRSAKFSVAFLFWTTGYSYPRFNYHLFPFLLLFAGEFNTIISSYIPL